MLVYGVLALALAAPGGASARQPDNPPGRTPGTRPIHRSPAPATSLIVTYAAEASATRRSELRAAERLDRVTNISSTTELVRPRGRSLASALTALRGRPEVAAVEPNHHRTIAADPTGEEFWPYQWGHHNVGQTIPDSDSNPIVGASDVDVDGRESLAVTTGSPAVVVAVIDDGVDFSHPDLGGTQWVNPRETGPDGLGGDKATNGVDDDANGYVDDVNGWDFCGNDNSVHDFGDDYHGTAVAGTIAAGLNGAGVVGIAPSTRIMALKFISDVSANPECNSDALAIMAINYAKSFGVRIINASWGGPSASAALHTAIANSGTLFVAAAGNGGDDGVGDNIDVSPDYPASFTAANILSVASNRNDGRMSVFSNYGRTSVDLTAPGEGIALPVPADADWLCGGIWCWMDGTSFSAPYVSGVAALVGGRRPDFLRHPTALRARLINGGVPLASQSGKTASGRLVNARRAIDFTPPVLTGAISVLPTATSIGASSATVRLSWRVATDDLAMASYKVEQRRNTGAWTVLTNATTARTRDVVIALSGTYTFRVTPRDAVGNLGAPVVSRVVTPLRYEEASTAVRYAGTWATASSTTFSGGKAKYTTASGASATLTFQGRTVALVAPVSRTRSSFKVYVDGVYVKTVSLYSATAKNRLVVFSTGTLASTTHTLKLVHARVGSRIRADVDAFIVLR